MTTRDWDEMVTVRDMDVFHWFWRLRALHDTCPEVPQALLTESVASSLRHEAVGLYVDSPLISVPCDLAMAVLDCLAALRTHCDATLAEQVAQDEAVLNHALRAA